MCFAIELQYLEGTLRVANLNMNIGRLPPFRTYGAAGLITLIFPWAYVILTNYSSSHTPVASMSHLDLMVTFFSPSIVFNTFLQMFLSHAFHLCNIGQPNVVDKLQSNIMDKIYMVFVMVVYNQIAIFDWFGIKEQPQLRHLKKNHG